MVRVEQVVPVHAQPAKGIGHHAIGRSEHEQPQHARHRRRHRVGPDQQRLVGRCAAQHAVGHHGQQQGDDQAEAGHHDGELRRHLEGGQVARVVEQALKIGHTHELRGEAESVLLQHALVQRLRSRPEEEHEHDGHLRGHQGPG